ncbi:MAG TPA: pirin [Maribacter sp.]|uniref:pirin family protein n=1 Tax=unclassified Maribacter TaxID=2615042 RepID=UPI000EC991F8|nr:MULTISPECIES: pirin family protein [unclassified Maribacter]HAF78151.1 pirin [Maribacter sp.]|tara:strand:+ start:112702 stop:113694 length:993 start_codon:yes stop_codon:yes gene_type:complete
MEIKNIFKLGFPWQTQDPFLFCVYHLDHYPKGNGELGPDDSLEGRTLGNDFEIKDGYRMYHGTTVPGFPAHPHRGFETITIVNKGFCDHSDSLGAAGRFGEGDVQWMTAGRGVQHSEMFPLVHTQKENPLELFQIWLNLPAKSKFVDPHFKMLWHEEIPVVKLENASVKVIAGQFKANNAPDPAPDSWANDPENDVAIWNITVELNGTLTLPKAKIGTQRTIYFYDGNTINLAGESIEPNHGVNVDATKEIKIEAIGADAHLLMLQGKPIEEPVAKYGPFVMNTDEELQNAMNEFRTTQFGGWPWRYPDHTHEVNRGRFAQYPDGTVIEK